MKMKKISNDLNIKEYSVLKNLYYCFTCTMNHYPLLLLWCFLAVLVNVLLPVVSTFLPKVVIDEISSKSSIERLVIVVMTFTISIAFLQGLKLFFRQFIYQHKFKMNSYYIRKISIKGMTTDYCNQENEHFRKLQSESYHSCNGHYSNLSVVYDTAIELLSNFLGLALYFGLLMKLNVIFLVFLIATSLISYYLNKKVIRWAAGNNKEKIGYEQKTYYINHVSGDIGSAKDIALYGMHRWFDQVYQANMKKIHNWYKCYGSKIFKISICDSGLSLIREGASYGYLLYLALSHKITLADFVLYFGVITGFTVWLGGILGQVNSLNRISLSINYLRAFLEYPESYKKEGGVAASSFSLPKTIELKNVSYRYEGSDSNTLHSINLVIHPQEHLAIVGLNGAGKTTLIKLICGLCDPSSGEVLYDGINVKEYNRSLYYKLFSAVFQQYSILPVTIEEIVAEALAEHIDSSKVELCLKEAGLWDKISTLAEGVKSKFGKSLYEDGVEFSGGEIQKLLLARALYKEAPIMILDEPTAALDPIAESKLYQTYSHLMKERSTIFISHRLASTRFCNRILFLENGSICEEGSHESLLSKRGKYYNLFETQARYYRENPEGEVAV